MAMSAANYQIAFGNMGTLIKLYNLLETNRLAVIEAIENGEFASVALIATTDYEHDVMENVLATQKTIDAGFESLKTQVNSRIEAYITDIVSKGIGFTGSSTSLADVLHDLAEDMDEGSQSIDGSAITATAPTYDEDNTGTGSLATPTSLSQLLTDEYWELECTSISGGAGAETWEVRGQPHLHAVLSAALTTAVAYNAVDENGEALFTTTLTAYTAGTGYKISGDAGALLSAYSFTGATKGTNTDSAGRVYLNVVDDGSGYRHVDVYKDSARTSLVAHTATYNTTGAKSLVADGGSGLTGSVTVATVAGTFTDLIVTVGFAFAVGDKLYFTTTNDEAGTFAEYFRKTGIALPVSLVGAETILDDLAE